jgi:hypothetical protein
VLPALLETHRPLDAVLLMLGTNDLKQRFSVNAMDIALSLERLVRVIRARAAGPSGAAPGSPGGGAAADRGGRLPGRDVRRWRGQVAPAGRPDRRHGRRNGLPFLDAGADDQGLARSTASIMMRRGEPGAGEAFAAAIRRHFA